MRIQWVAALLAVGLGVFAPCAPAGSAVPAVRFEAAPCGLDELPEDWARERRIDCGWVTVRARRDASDQATLRLWVIRVAARVAESADRRPPVIRVLGGPTPVETFYLTNPRTTELSLAHDNIFFDYRGLGRSEPKLACKVDPVAGTTPAERLQSKIAQYTECRRQIVAAGIDLAAISSHAYARDIEDIARALGYDRYYISAGSYGSVPAFDLIRARPACLHAAVVITPLVPNSTLADPLSGLGEALALMQQACNRDPLCRKRFPDIAGTLARAMERVERESLMAGERRVTPYDLFVALYEIALQTERLPLLPLAIETAATGDAALVARWLGIGQGYDFFLPEVRDPVASIQVTVNCADATAGNEPMAPKIESAARRFPHLAKAAMPVDAFDRLCAAWNPAPVSKTARAPAISDVHALLVNARLDPVTPASDTRLAARSLSRSTVIEHPGASHDFAIRDPCLIGIEAAFFADPEDAIDRSCAGSYRPVTFAYSGFEEYVDSRVR